MTRPRSTVNTLDPLPFAGLADTDRLGLSGKFDFGDLVMVCVDFRILSFLRQLDPMARRLGDYLSVADDVECVLILLSFNLIRAGFDLSMADHRGLGSAPFSRVGFVGASPNSEGKNQDREPTEELLCTPTHLAISFRYERGQRSVPEESRRARGWTRQSDPRTLN
jgi:hypothetical protein